MTVQPFRQKKRLTFILASFAIIAIGVSVFVLSYGISDGWDAVAGWFSSKNAIILYILLGCYALGVLMLYVSDWIRKL